MSQNHPRQQKYLDIWFETMIFQNVNIQHFQKKNRTSVEFRNTWARSDTHGTEPTVVSAGFAPHNILSDGLQVENLLNNTLFSRLLFQFSVTFWGGEP